MSFEDITLRCRECSADFVWTAGEQMFFQQKGLLNQPQRCPNCRNARRRVAAQASQMYEVACAECGQPARIPFQPRQDRPVYCSDCFERMKTRVARPV